MVRYLLFTIELVGSNRLRFGKETGERLVRPPYIRARLGSASKGSCQTAGTPQHGAKTTLDQRLTILGKPDEYFVDVVAIACLLNKTVIF